MKVLGTFDRGVALLTSLCHNLVPGVSLLCLHCRWEKTFLNDNGGREERPWKRGWLCQREAARVFSFCSVFCGYFWSLSCMAMHGRIREGKTGWFLLVEYYSWLASYIKSRISYLQFFSGPRWFLRFPQRLLTQKLPWQSWFLSFYFQGFVSMHLYDYSVNLIG